MKSVNKHPIVTGWPPNETDHQWYISFSHIHQINDCRMKMVQGDIERLDRQCIELFFQNAVKSNFYLDEFCQLDRKPFLRS